MSGNRRKAIRPPPIVTAVSAGPSRSSRVLASSPSSNGEEQELARKATAVADVVVSETSPSNQIETSTAPIEPEGSGTSDMTVRELAASFKAYQEENKRVMQDVHMLLKAANTKHLDAYKSVREAQEAHADAVRDSIREILNEFDDVASKVASLKKELAEVRALAEQSPAPADHSPAPAKQMPALPEGFQASPAAAQPLHDMERLILRLEDKISSSINSAISNVTGETQNDVSNSNSFAKGKQVASGSGYPEGMSTKPGKLVEGPDLLPDDWRNAFSAADIDTQSSMLQACQLAANAINNCEVALDKDQCKALCHLVFQRQNGSPIDLPEVVKPRVGVPLEVHAAMERLLQNASKQAEITLKSQVSGSNVGKPLASKAGSVNLRLSLDYLVKYGQETRRISAQMGESTFKLQKKETISAYVKRTSHLWYDLAESFTYTSPYRLVMAYKSIFVVERPAIATKLEKAMENANFTTELHPFGDLSAHELTRKSLEFIRMHQDVNLEQNITMVNLEKIRLYASDSYESMEEKINLFTRDAELVSLAGHDGYRVIKNLFSKWESEKVELIRSVDRAYYQRLEQSQEKVDKDADVPTEKLKTDDFISALARWFKKYKRENEYMDPVHKDADAHGKKRGLAPSQSADKSENPPKRPRDREMFRLCWVCGGDHDSRRADHSHFKVPRENNWDAKDFKDHGYSNLNAWNDGKKAEMKDPDGTPFSAKVFERQAQRAAQEVQGKGRKPENSGRSGRKD